MGKVVAVVQARMGSSRLPGKVMADVCGRPMIERVVERVRAAHLIDEVWAAVPHGEYDQSLRETLAAIGCPFVEGPSGDPLSRFASALRESSATTVVRITGDCPLVDPAGIDYVVDAQRHSRVGYVSNTAPRTVIHGLDVEVFTPDLLRGAARHASGQDREHVTPWIQRRAEEERRSLLPALAPFGPRTGRWCVDESADLEFVRSVYERLPHPLAGHRIVERVVRDAEIAHINAHVRQKAVGE